MAQQKKGLITRLLEGREKSEEYARSTLPTNRWQLFWDIFKGNFGKIVKVNLLTIIFFIPLIAFIVLYVMVTQSNGILYPFGANLGVGYPASPEQQGLTEIVAMQSAFVLYAGLFVGGAIAAVGLAGGLYVIRNMVWTEGVFVSNDFWRGIKLNFKNVFQTVLFFSLSFTLCDLVIRFCNLSLAVTEPGKWQRICTIASLCISYLLLVMAIMMSLWMFSLGVNYDLKFIRMLKNSFFMMLGTFPQTIFFGVLGLLPFALFLPAQEMLFMIAAVIVLLFGVAYFLLVWMDFSQWVFDKYVNPKIEGAKVGRGIYGKNRTSQLMGDDSQASIEYQRTILAYGKSKIVANPVKPIDDSLQVYELSATFSREDLKQLRESKRNIIEDSEAYAEEHKNDLRYVEYNRQFEERERALQEEDAKKKKKRKPPKLLGE